MLEWLSFSSDGKSLAHTYLSVSPHIPNLEIVAFYGCIPRFAPRNRKPKMKLYPTYPNPKNVRSSLHIRLPDEFTAGGSFELFLSSLWFLDSIEMVRRRWHQDRPPRRLGWNRQGDSIYANTRFPCGNTPTVNPLFCCVTCPLGHGRPSHAR